MASHISLEIRRWECNTSYVQKRNFTVEAKNILAKRGIIVTSML